MLSPIARKAEASAAVEAAEVLADAVVLCRDSVDTPPGDCTPPLLADLVTAAHREVTRGRGAPKVKLEVFDHEQLAAMGCGGILSISSSSVAPSRLVKTTWAPTPWPTSRSSARASPSTPAASPSSRRQA